MNQFVEAKSLDEIIKLHKEYLTHSVVQNIFLAFSSLAHLVLYSLLPLAWQLAKYNPVKSCHNLENPLATGYKIIFNFSFLDISQSSVST